jgi:hypothetical protein
MVAAMMNEIVVLEVGCSREREARERRERK